MPADLSTEAECRRLPAVAEREERLDILVNRARAPPGVRRSTSSTRSPGSVLSLNVKSVFHLTKFLVPLLEKAGSADEPARHQHRLHRRHPRARPGDLLYSASKAAVHQLTRHLARRLAAGGDRQRHRPGPFESKMMAATLDAFGDQIAASAPLKRIGRPDDMAGTAIFLASRAGAYLTGAVIPVDGGIATVA